MHPGGLFDLPATVGIGGLGAIGFEVARRLDAAPGNLELSAVSARDPAAARKRLAVLGKPPALVPLDALAECDIVVEALPAALFRRIAAPAIDGGKILVVSSAGALLQHLDLVALAGATGARIVVASGALAGLDAVRAIAEDEISRIAIETRKPPKSLEGAPYLKNAGIDMASIATAELIFAGNARDAAIGFPSNANVAAALALAGIGPDRTMVEIWADPSISRNRHTIFAEARASWLSIVIESEPSAINPRTGQLAPLSVLACLRGLAGTLKIGS